MTGRIARSDSVLATLLLFWGVFDVLTGRMGGPLLPAVVAMLLMTLPLAMRQIWPLEVLATIGVGVALSVRIDVSGADADSAVACVLIALYSCGAYADGLRAWIGLIAAVAFTGAALGLTGDSSTIGDYTSFEAATTFSWLVGYVVRRHRRRSEEAELREARAEAGRLVAVEEERARIAGELHDVVAHAISMIVVQARAAQRVLDHEPAMVVKAFDSIEEAGTEALAEMRRLLVLLRTPADLASPPSLRDLHVLAARMDAAGLPVETIVEGRPVELPDAVDVTAYRIIQEGLTNALRHAGPARALVRLRYCDDQLDLEIRDDGRGPTSGSTAGAGLAGIRERVSVFGGEMRSGGAEDGGYSLRVLLPLGRVPG